MESKAFFALYRRMFEVNNIILGRGRRVTSRRNLDEVESNGQSIGSRLTSRPRRNLDSAAEPLNSVNARNTGRCYARARGRGRSSRRCASDSVVRSRASPPSSSGTSASSSTVLRPRGICSRGRNQRPNRTSSSTAPTRNELIGSFSDALYDIVDGVRQRINSRLDRSSQGISVKQWNIQTLYSSTYSLKRRIDNIILFSIFLFVKKVF